MSDDVSKPEPEAPKLTEQKPAKSGDFSAEELTKRYEAAIADNISYRSERRDYKAKIAELEEQARRVTELEQAHSKLEASAREKVALVDVKARLRSEGISDPDVLKMFDLSAVKFDKQGDPTNLDELWGQFHETKSYLFSGAKPKDTSSSSVSGKPEPKQDSFDWMTATAEEVAKARKPSRAFNN